MAAAVAALGVVASAEQLHAANDVAVVWGSNVFPGVKARVAVLLSGVGVKATDAPTCAGAAVCLAFGNSSQANALIPALPRG